MTIEQIADQITQDNSGVQPILIAIEGFGGSGKTTFANKLADILGDAYVISIDDFIIKEKLTEHSWDKGAFDRARLEDEVLAPIAAGRPASFRKLIWATNELSELIWVPNTKYLIIEGISSYHPKIAHYYTYKIWVDTPIEVAKKRGYARDGNNENAIHWDLWTANDLAYQDKYHPEEQADFIFQTN
jgi:uridine kinase